MSTVSPCYILLYTQTHSLTLLIINVIVSLKEHVSTVSPCYILLYTQTHSLTLLIINVI